MIIVTHTNPDWDAICGVWLLKRFLPGFEDAQVSFVNTGNPDSRILFGANAVVDTGKEWSSAYLRFDHHQLPGQASNDTCAAKMVFDYLLFEPTVSVAHLEPLIDLVFWGDTGRSGASPSRDLGIHALLSGAKSLKAEQGWAAPDNEVLEFGFQLLDILNHRLKKQAEARTELAEKIVYKSRDGYVWAIKEGSQAASYAAYEEGARLVIFLGEPVETEGGTTYPVGMMRAGEWQEPHVGELVTKLRGILQGCGEETPEYAIWSELERWFLHPAGFFGGRGTAKAPVFEPVAIDLQLLASLIDTTWDR